MSIQRREVYLVLKKLPDGRVIYVEGIRCAHNWGLTLSGTKTHVKQRFLPLTPLLMVSDVLWSPVLPA